MELSQLQQFKAIAEYGTITKAAEKLYLSQPALSMMLKKLESELGVTLFVRKHNRLILTEAGEMVLGHVKNIEEQLEAIIHDSKRFYDQTDRVSGMFCSRGIMWYYVPLFLKKYPEIHLEVGGFQESEEDADLLREYKTDFLITSRPINKSGIESVPFYSDQHYLAVPEDDPLTVYADTGLDKNSFREVKEILYLNQPDDSYCQKFLNFVRGQYPDIKLIIHDDYFMFSQIASGSSKPTITTKLVLNYRKEGAYTNIPLNIPELDIQYYVCYLKSKKKKIETVLNWKNMEI